MVDKALIDIARRAAARRQMAAGLALRPPSHHAVTPTTTSKLADQVRSRKAATTTQLLDRVSSEYDSALRQSTFEGKVAADPSTAAILAEQALTTRCQQLPHTYALEAAGVLLRAGRTEEAMQLVTGWRLAEAEGGIQSTSAGSTVDRTEHNGSSERRDFPYALTRRQRARASTELTRTIAALRDVCDADSLRTVAELLEASLEEQAGLNHASPHSSSAYTSAHRWCSPKDVVQQSTYRLLAPLGPRRTCAALVEAVEALCTLTDDAGVFLTEKIAWIGKASAAFARVTDADGYTARGARMLLLPPSLQPTFATAVESDSAYTEALATSIVPMLTSALVHPSQYTLRSTLLLPMKEAKAARRALAYYLDESSEAATASCGSAGILSLVPRFLGSSTPLQHAAVNRAVLAARTASHDKHNDRPSMSPTEMAQARDALLAELRSRDPRERRATSAALLRHPRLLRGFHLSPVPVLAVFGGTFHSVGRTCPRLVRLSLRAVPALVRRGSEESAARLAWNHLSSPQCSATIQQLRKHPQYYDAVTVAVCRAMRRWTAKRGFSRSAWMGHRSLALLRVAHAADALSPIHVLVTCVCALDVGVHFATVRDLVEEVYPVVNHNDNSEDREAWERNAPMRKWVLDCIRVCADAQDEPMRVRLARRSLPQHVRSLLIAWCRRADECSHSTNRTVRGDGCTDAQGFLSVRAPSRSKQLALWAATGDVRANPRLAALTMALFLDATAREALLNCDGLARNARPRDGARSSCRAETCSEKEQTKVSPSTFYAWEVAASMAANCSNDSVYAKMLRALEQRCPVSRRAGDEDAHRPRLYDLLRTEVDHEDDAPLVKLKGDSSRHNGDRTLAADAAVAGV